MKISALMNTNKKLHYPGLPFDLHADPSETLTDGLTFQWIFDHQAVAFVAQHAERTLVDAWIGKVGALVAQWPREKPFFAFCDFTAKNCASTPYARERNRQLLNAHPGRKTRVAMVVQDTFSMQLSRFFIRAFPNPQHHVNLTFKVADGLIWLHKQVEEYNQAVAQV
jgi:hypothetical protein